MRPFAHTDAYSLDQACQLLAQHKGVARLNAGGTDLLSVLNSDILPDYPDLVVNLKTIPDLDYIREDGTHLAIGALARLSVIASSPLIRSKYGLLADAARTVASPQIRNVATIGGNLCQDTRCWYYRYPRGIGGPIQCLRKGEGRCLAVSGDHRYHAIMGGKKCFAVCPSDAAVALTALDGSISVIGPGGERSVDIPDFFHPLGNVLAKGEVVREIRLPLRNRPSQQRFLKFTLRKPIDFAIVSVACTLTLEQDKCVDARIVLGGVAPTPVRALRAERALLANPINEQNALAAANEALDGAKPLPQNAYKVDIAKSLIKKAILGPGD